MEQIIAVPRSPSHRCWVANTARRVQAASNGTAVKKQHDSAVPLAKLPSQCQPDCDGQGRLRRALCASRCGVLRSHNDLLAVCCIAIVQSAQAAAAASTRFPRLHGFKFN
eukprot:TRINITY_DN9527_c0_g1_i2.p1 TRINITY_DN9527_c0_g1~~TRINITY_DN9527_c0_g1_i2.p1  ORF type:complete len:126 (+),score=18.17 TRINITY_DN9527_c0_g1_i2:51-380(+)